MDRELIVEKSSPEARAKRLKRVRNLANLSRKEMCSEDSQLKLNTLKGWEIAKFGGLSKVGAEKVVKRLYGTGVVCSVDWLMHEVGEPPKVQVSDNAKIINEDFALSSSKDEQFILNELLLFRTHYKNCIDLMIIDDAMSPFYNAKGYVAGLPSAAENEFTNKACIVVLPTGEKLLREIRKSNQKGLYSLVAVNPATTVSDPIIHNVRPEVIAPVIWHRQKIIKR